MTGNSNCGAFYDITDLHSSKNVKIMEIKERIKKYAKKCSKVKDAKET